MKTLTNTQNTNALKLYPFLLIMSYLHIRFIFL
jgi:hypothetical protein